jgi:FAD:protein FMN transferase
MKGHFQIKLGILTILLIALSNCNEKSNKIIRIAGEAQGTTYHITLISDIDVNYKQEIDSILKGLDQSLSTYVPTSIISKFNSNDSSAIADKYFTNVFNKAIEISTTTKGFFDVTVGPLINAWGFGLTKKSSIDSATIDSIRQYVGYKMVQLKGKKLIKAKPQMIVDFNAIAQGYSVDILASYLESKGISNYLVELGGEVKAKGKKNTREYWKVGIDQPNETTTDERPLQAVVQLKDRALATSGNYRKFIVEGGQKYSHIINPITGYPAKHNLLSATVIADDCMSADAYATAFMVMGLEKSKQFLLKNKELKLEVHFIYDEHGVWKTYTSDSLQKSIHKN